ncbi:MAG: cyclase family protein [Planctomycetaceae bacterium]|nr:cyclase family protein [Planctomycetaceae bacterium]
MITIHSNLHKALPIVIGLLLSIGCREPEEFREMSPQTPEKGSTTTLVPTNLGAQLAAATMIDLTHSFDEETIFWPTEEGFRLERGPAGFTQSGYFYAANRFRLAEHGGTHTDAPIHFFKDRETVDEIPLHRLIGEAVIIDVREACQSDRDYQIGINDLRNWETTHQRQLVDVIVLLWTGYGRHWPDREKYLGTKLRGEEAVSELHFPGLSPDAATWLVENRMIKAIGIDTASIDHGQSRSFGSHVTLFERNIPAFENVANLDSLPLRGINIIALPMKIRSGTGGPLRIIALLEPATTTSR